MSTALDVVDRLTGIPTHDYQFRSRPELESLREQLRSARDDAYQQLRSITDSASGRPLTVPQRTDFDAAERRVEAAGRLLQDVDQGGGRDPEPPVGAH